MAKKKSNSRIETEEEVIDLGELITDFDDPGEIKGLFENIEAGLDGEVEGISDIGERTVFFLPLKNTVVFPNIPSNLYISRDDEEHEIEKCKIAYKTGSEMVLVAQRRPKNMIFPVSGEFYSVGCVGKIQSIDEDDDGANVLFEGSSRAVVLGPRILHEKANIVDLPDEGFIDLSKTKNEVAVSTLKRFYLELSRQIPKFPRELRDAVLGEKDLSKMMDAMAFSVLISFEDKQRILEKTDLAERLELLRDIMTEELETVYQEMSLHKKVRQRIDKGQREYYLREQLKVIKEELGEDGGYDGFGADLDETQEYIRKLNELDPPKEVREKIEKEISKLAQTPYTSAESTVLRNYIDICLEVPWKKKTRDVTDVARAKKQLDKDHYGLEKVKERILEFIAARKLNPEIKNQIICLVGAPGVGKTSVAESLAKAMGRKYVRVSLGGVKDEADIRGHRKTYIGSMPGRIVDALTKVKVNNPLILLDEIDKMSNDYKGDPSSAMLEVLDSEQNKAFRDHFLELPVDLSDCIFIATANSLERVARPLIDRMEVIELPMYNRREKFEIAKKYLIPKQMKRHGLTKRMFKIKDEIIYELADFYTHEAGVRNLEREIASLCRKAAKDIVEGASSVTVDKDTLVRYLGPRKILPDNIYPENEVGTVNGLAYTELGGEMLRVEAVAMSGTGKADFTGSLGDVMKESAHIAITYIRSHAEKLGIDPDFYKTKDIHIHFPEGAVPKDGPSAGVALACAITSELGGYPARKDVAMTGEITLHGRVLPIGGLKEKTMAAYKAGIKTVLLPEDNRKDIPELDEMVKDNISFIFCRTVTEAISHALIMPEAAR